MIDLFQISITISPMKLVRTLAGVTAGLAFAANLSAGEAALPQRVLYVGHRGAEFEPLLQKHFAKVQIVSRTEFKPSAAQDFDVVLLDWPQSEEARAERTGKSPLGARAEWTKPTVLLGSAGLNLAVVWKLKGGSG